MTETRGLDDRLSRGDGGKKEKGCGLHDGHIVRGKQCPLQFAEKQKRLSRQALIEQDISFSE